MFLQLHGCMSSPSDSESPVWRPMGPCWRLGNRPDCRLIRKSAQESVHASRNLPYLVSRSAHPAQRAVLLTGMESKNGRSRRFYPAPFAGTTAHRWAARVLVHKREDVVPSGPRNETGSLRTLESAAIIRGELLIESVGMDQLLFIGCVCGELMTLSEQALLRSERIVPSDWQRDRGTW